ncbi:bifunctional metallophosphatase/5'-nucleotidase [Lacticaseibacillus porcinae]|uniref:bifunctional metallophosphatase/5'-nucleotidase n=1 Tax=Lacticaseibacillus porcinae TaxID=1123687 RepID=UPI000F7B12AD|nr:bifunctional metallophosphatase/5'-nucleotidase [Lacticaseibacillus porcinae]
MQLTILSTSDTHGFVLPTNYAKRDQALPFGLTRAATVLAQHQDAATLTIDNGDWLQGSPLAYYAARIANDVSKLTDAYNAVGYDAGVLGNHEFNYGAKYLSKAIAQLNYPILCANILRDGKPAFGRAYQVFEKAGVRVAVLGLTTSYIPHWETPTNIEGLEFANAVDVAKTWVPKLHELADVVVITYHGGFERDLETGKPTEKITGENVGYQLTQIPGVDALVTGHQHRELAGVVNGVPVTQPGYRGANVGQITLTLEATAAGWQVVKGDAQLLKTAQAMPDSSVEAAVATTNAAVEDWLDSPLGHVNGDMSLHSAWQARIHESAYIEFINKVQMAATGADISGTALFTNDGRGFNQTITMRDVVTNYVYPNTLAVLKLSGADLKAALEQNAEYFSLDDAGKLKVTPRFIHPKPQHYNYDMYQGIDYVLDISRPVGQRVVNLTYHGQPVTPDAEYEVVANQYRAGGGGNFAMFGQSKVIRENQKDMTELIADYLRAHPQIDATVDNNFQVVTKM